MSSYIKANLCHVQRRKLNTCKVRAGTELYYKIANCVLSMRGIGHHAKDKKAYDIELIRTVHLKSMAYVKEIQ